MKKIRPFKMEEINLNEVPELDQMVSLSKGVFSQNNNPGSG